MNRKDILKILRRHGDELKALGISSLALFGSAARDDMKAESDIDLLVEFATPPGFRGYMRARQRLEELLGLKVDLVMKGALKPEAWETVRKEMVDVA